MSADTIEAVTEAQDAQRAWLRSLADHNEKKNPKAAKDLRLVAQNLEFIMGRVSKIYAARITADGIAFKNAADAAAADKQKSLDDLKATFPPAADVLDPDDKSMLAAEADALGLDAVTGEKKAQ